MIKEALSLIPRSLSRDDGAGSAAGPFDSFLDFAARGLDRAGCGDSAPARGEVVARRARAGLA